MSGCGGEGDSPDTPVGRRPPLLTRTVVLDRRFLELDGARASARDCRLVLEAPEVAREGRPGQFVHVACPPGRAPDGLPGRPFLRRPLSLHDTDPRRGTVTLLFRVKGTGTAALAALEPGDRLDLLGPLGRGFPPPRRCRRAVLVGGGLGLAPLLLLAKDLVGRLHREELGGVELLAGLAGREDLGLLEPFREQARAGLGLAVATEDGAPGTVRGLVTDLLSAVLETHAGNVAVYACGPVPMLAAVARMARRVGVGEAWLSVEARMACGVGACRGCAVPAPPGSRPVWRLVCREGPVFPLDALDWEALARDG
ncbi:MAG: dihydroorotate dehydrogenase electron transfer subunit [Firmicutes bacterium]|nr:dihydroorotate dehydrogenase electron transfer subunit [Bacillota bacterium]